MKVSVIAIASAFIAFWASPSLSAANDSKQLNLDDSGLAIQGYDPVSYFEGKPEKGRPEFTFKSQGATYRFGNETHRKSFAEDAAKYTPEYGGWCAYAMLDGDQVEINPERFKVIEGKLYLYYDGFWGNTLKKWNKLLEARSEPELVNDADNQWAKLTAKP